MKKMLRCAQVFLLVSAISGYSANVFCASKSTGVWHAIGGTGQEKKYCVGAYIDVSLPARPTDSIPGSHIVKVPTSANGYHLIAFLNGRRWTALSMNPLVTAGVLAGYGKDEYIVFPVDKFDARQGNIIALGPNSTIQLKMKNWPGKWHTNNGEIEFTKVDDHWAEGRFWVSMLNADGSARIEITTGSFRVSLDRFSGRTFVKEP